MPSPLHPDIHSVIQLITAHADKFYYSGFLVRRPGDGQQRPDEVWFKVWAHLSGTTLSIWDMAKDQQASKQGKELPPTYVDTTHAFVQVIGDVTIAGRPSSPSQEYAHVFSIDTAGSNLLLFSCPDTIALISWVSALRLSSWEKSHLEEIYTGQLLRIMLKHPMPSTLVRGRLEGWVRVCIPGQTDWKRMWMVISAGADSTAHAGPNEAGVGGVRTPTLTASLRRKKTISSLFARDTGAQVLPSKPLVLMYASQRQKDRKRALLSMRGVTQAFAVYPEYPEPITRSTSIKVEGTFGEEEMGAAMRDREGRLLVMPELNAEYGGGQAEMLKWLTAIHDAFELYGRPEMWTWDPRDPVSLVFAYPIGLNRDHLFLSLDETLNPWDESTASIRSRLTGILLNRIRGIEVVQPPHLASNGPPTLPPIQLPRWSLSDATLLDLVRRQVNVEAPVAQSSYVGLTSPPHEGLVLNHAIANSSRSSLPQQQSAPRVELARSLSLQSSVVDVRCSFDMQSNSQGFTAPPQVNSTIFSASVFNKSQADGHMFAPLKQVSERRAKVQAQQAAHQIVMHKPSDLAATVSCSEKLQEAKNPELEVFKVRTKSFGSHHPDIIQAMFNLAVTFWQSGQIAEAEKLEQEILEVSIQAFGNNHPDTIQAMADVATIFWLGGKIVEAEKLDQEVLELRNKVFGKTHKSTQQAMSNLAATFRKSGKLKEAEVLQQEVLQIQKEAFGSSHPDTIQAMSNLTITYWQGGKLEEAKKLNQEVLEIKKEAFGDSIQVMCNLAATYWQSGNLEEAEKFEQKVHQMRKGEFESITISASN